MPRERRLQLLLLTEQEIIQLFQTCFLAARRQGTRQFISLPLHPNPDIFDSISVHGCTYMPDRGAWAIALSHPDWPDIPLGECLPILDFNERIVFHVREALQKAANEGN